jgi:phospholipid/cholesterol/gamma-HCH transport system substrate-binding protein
MRALRGHLLTIGLTAGLAAAFMVIMLAANGAKPGLHRGGYTLRAVVPTAVSLGTGAEVRIAGLPVGRVRSIDRRGTSVVVGLDIAKRYGPVPRDTRFAVRLRSLIGENYVELFPGRARATLADGGVLPLTAQASEYVDLEQILDQLKGGTRTRARRLVQGLGGALDGRGPALNATVDGTSGVLRDVSPLMRTLGTDRRQVARLVTDVGDVMRDVGARGQAIRSLARDLRRSTTAVAGRDDAVRATFQALPGVLHQAQGTAGVLRATTRVAAPVVEHLATAVTALRPALRELRPAAATGSTTVRELGRAAPKLSRVLDAVDAVAPSATAALPQARKVLCQVNPMLSFLSPYARDLSAVFQNMASATNYYDANGHAARLHAMVGEASLPPTTDGLNDALDAVLEGGLVSQVHEIGYNPQPRAGDTVPPVEGRNQSGARRSTLKYTRVPADC